MYRLDFPRFLPALVLPLLAGCQDFVICTLDAPPAIELLLTNSVSDAYILGAQGTVTEGTYSDSLYSVGEGLYIAATQRGGTYAIHVEHPNYSPWDTTGVRVHKSEGGCPRVTTVRLDRSLDPLP